MEDEINRLQDMLAQLPPDRLRAILPRLIRAVEWFSELETSETGREGIVSHSISFGFSTSRHRVSQS